MYTHAHPRTHNQQINICTKPDQARVIRIFMLLPLFLISTLLSIVISSQLKEYNPKLAFDYISNDPILPCMFTPSSDGLKFEGEQDILSKIAPKTYHLLTNPKLNGLAFVRSSFPQNLDPIPDDENLVLHMNVPVGEVECTALFYHHNANLIIKYTDAENWVQVMIKRPNEPRHVHLLTSIAGILSQENSTTEILSAETEHKCLFYQNLLGVAGTSLMITDKFGVVHGLEHMNGLKVRLNEKKFIILCVENDRLKRISLLDRIANDKRLPEILVLPDTLNRRLSKNALYSADSPPFYDHRVPLMNFDDIMAYVYQMIRHKDNNVVLVDHHSLDDGLMCAVKVHEFLIVNGKLFIPDDEPIKMYLATFGYDESDRLLCCFTDGPGMFFVHIM